MGTHFMPIYRISNDKINQIERTTFEQQGIKERQDLQSMLKLQIDVIAPDTLVVAEEFGDWEGSRRRIDLLAIDKDANLVVIELKRSQDGGHMELQALRYASMISTLTFDKLVDVYTHYLNDQSIQLDARDNLLDFLDWTEPNDDQFAQVVKIILASADFSKELTTSVMWLNDFGLDIQCVRIRPYIDNEDILLDVQTLIPIPEAADYQIKVHEKKQRERESRKNQKDYTKFDISIANETFHSENKRWTMFHIISVILREKHSPEQIIEAVPQKGNRLFKVFEGNLSSDEVLRKMESDFNGEKSYRRRHFIKDDELFYFNDKTYALSNQWGADTRNTIDSLANNFPDLNIKVNPAE